MNLTMEIERSVTAGHLDKNLKEDLRLHILSCLLKRYGEVPLQSESFKILALVQDEEVTTTLEEMIRSYYYDMIEQNLKIDLEPKDYVDIYLHRI